MNKENDLMIQLPTNLYMNGSFKTIHSVKIESNFNGILLTKSKVIIEGNSTFEGDLICSELILTGKIKGNIFCTGKVHAKQNCEIIGSVFTCRFENDESTNLDCLITVPKTQVIDNIKLQLQNIDLESKENSDNALSIIIETFKKNEIIKEQLIELEKLQNTEKIDSDINSKTIISPEQLSNRISVKR